MCSLNRSLPSAQPLCEQSAQEALMTGSASFAIDALRKLSTSYGPMLWVLSLQRDGQNESFGMRNAVCLVLWEVDR